VAAVATPWVAWGVEALRGRPFRFGRVYDRVFEVVLVVGLVAQWRRLDLGGPVELGLRRPAWAREIGAGLVVGLCGVVAAFLVGGVLGGIVPELRFAAMKTVRKALLGVGAAVAIGVGEEVLFRGLLLRRLTRDTGRVAGVLLTTAIYAAVHAIGKAPASGPVTAWSGIERTAALLAPVTTTVALPELVGLALLGLVLAAARLRTGSLWVPIGIHAAWVAAFRVGRLFVTIRPTPVWLVGPGWPPLIGGAAGWIGLAVTAVVLFGWRAGRGR
jgi:membrane protease YdiL (CAAX protease family)